MAPTTPQSPWQPASSADAVLRLSEAGSGATPVLQMDFEFKPGGGYVVARRAWSRAMPADYAVQCRLRGRGVIHQLELKLVDASGQNVWRRVIENLKLGARWKRLRVPSRDIDFAWGPAGGGSIVELGFIEFAVVAREAGEGSLEVAEVAVEDLTPKEPPRATASSAMPGFEAAAALGTVGWRPQSDDRRPWIAVDSRAPRGFGGLVIDWRERAPASGFRVRTSTSGLRWKTIYTAESAGGTRSYVYLPDARSRFLRLELDEPSAGASLTLQSYEFSRSLEAFWQRIAASETRGAHPRWLHREQSLWTPVGTSHGEYCMLINEDGMVEPALGSCSIEPMLMIDGRLVTWADVEARQELLADWAPVATVVWQSADWRLRIRAEATVSGALKLRYGFENLGARAVAARLFVLVRPFQVTPPWQKFRALGGVSPIRDLVAREGEVWVNENLRLIARPAAAQFTALRFDQGLPAAQLQPGPLPGGSAAHDASGNASGVFAFDWPLQPRGSAESQICCAIGNAPDPDEPAFDWLARIAVDQWSGNDWAADAIRTLWTATAQILVTRSGPALQPGPRRYTRSWIRDGAMMSAALLRMGHAAEVREFIAWYAPHQRADGFVPCCVDREGTDWLVEHDSHGQLLALFADYHRFTGDDQFLADSWSYVERAVDYIEHALEPSGLMPISVSHEGYLAQPVHSYWDDFWTLRGLRDAVALAEALGRVDAAVRWRPLAARVERALFDSIEQTRSQRKLETIPASIEWADYDPTATANAIALFDVPESLDRAALDRTFDRYLADWRRKRAGTLDAPSYTPYEIRIIGALVRMGRRDAALELLRFFLDDRRPLAWNQWPEIAWRDRKTAAHMGDLPHTWIAAEYVLAVRSLFAYERESDGCLVLAAGLALPWIGAAGVKVQRMPTLYGTLSYTLCELDAATLRFDIGRSDAAKLVLRPPLRAPLRSVTLNGAVYTAFDADSVTVAQTPAQVICSVRI